MYALPVGENIAANELVILDLGANVGAYSLYCCVNYRIAKILAYEPDPDTFNKLNNNVRRNGLNDKILTFQKAVCAEDGPIPFNADPESSRGSSVMRTFNDRKDGVMVSSTSLTSIFKENGLDYCDIAKIDIEGSEYEALFHCPKEILAKLRMVFVECHDGFTSLNEAYAKKSVRTFLEENGFVVLRDEDSMLVAKNSLFNK